MKKNREKVLVRTGTEIMISLVIIAGLSIVGIGMASAVPTVSIDPPSITGLSPSDTFSINVSVDPEEYGVLGCKIDLTYNASAFTVTDADITEGELISPKLMTEPGSGVKAPGWIHYGIVRTPADTPVPTDPGTFITVTFSVNSGAVEDIYTLSLSNVTLNNESGVEIPGVEVHGGNVTIGVAATTGDIIINEIMYDPEGSEYQYEWVELYNNDTIQINITDWKIDNKAISEKTMQPGDYVVLSENKTAFESRYGTLPCVMEVGSLSFSNTGEDTIVLENATEMEMDSVTYDPTEPTAPLQNYTLELNATGGWESSLVDGGTPCEQNSVVGPPAPTTTVTQTPEPNAAGWNKETVILSFLRVDYSGTGVNYTNLSATPDVNAVISNNSWTWDVTLTGENISVPLNATLGDIFNVTISDDCDVTISYYSVDKNETPRIEATKTVPVKIDTIDPVINSMELDTDDPGAGRPILVTVNATDALSGVEKVTAAASVTATPVDLAQNGNWWNGTITAEFLQGTYNITVIATDNASNTATNDTWQYTIAEEYGVSLTDPADQSTYENINATYEITVENTGNVADTFNLSVINTNNAAVAELNTAQVLLGVGESTTITLDVTDETAGTYNVSVYAESVNDSAANYTVTIMTPVSVLQYTLTILSTAGGSVTDPSGEGPFTRDAGTVVSLKAVAASGYEFDKWTGGVGTIANVNAKETTIIMNADYTIKANFKETYVGGRGGGGAPRDTDDDGYTDIQEMLAGTDKDDPCDPNPECAACLATKPAATPTPTAAPTAKPTAKPTTPPVPTPEPTAEPEPTATPEPPGFEAVFAIAGLLAVAYLVVRRKRK